MKLIHSQDDELKILFRIDESTSKQGLTGEQAISAFMQVAVLKFLFPTIVLERYDKTRGNDVWTTIPSTKEEFIHAVSRLLKVGPAEMIDEKSKRFIHFYTTSPQEAAARAIALVEKSLGNITSPDAYLRFQVIIDGETLYNLTLALPGAMDIGLSTVLTVARKHRDDALSTANRHFPQDIEERPIIWIATDKFQADGAVVLNSSHLVSLLLTIKGIYNGQAITFTPAEQYIPDHLLPGSTVIHLDELTPETVIVNSPYAGLLFRDLKDPTNGLTKIEHLYSVVMRVIAALLSVDFNIHDPNRFYIRQDHIAECPLVVKLYLKNTDEFSDYSGGCFIDLVNLLDEHLPGYIATANSEVLGTLAKPKSQDGDFKFGDKVWLDRSTGECLFHAPAVITSKIYPNIPGSELYEVHVNLTPFGFNTVIPNIIAHADELERRN